METSCFLKTSVSPCHKEALWASLAPTVQVSPPSSSWLPARRRRIQATLRWGRRWSWPMWTRSTMPWIPTRPCTSWSPMAMSWWSSAIRKWTHEPMCPSSTLPVRTKRKRWACFRVESATAYTWRLRWRKAATCCFSMNLPTTWISIRFGLWKKPWKILEAVRL